MGIVVLVAAFVFGCGRSPSDLGGSKDDEHIGSASCRECHARFYGLWATSHHGLAMQPYTARLAKEKLQPHKDEITIGKSRYRADIDTGGGGRGRMIEHGPQGEREYPIVHVLGGKNVYYFLTPSDRGRLQVLPLAYDVARKEWYDTTASAVRHFGDRQDEALDWHERELTFNTSCFNCHVSQLATNYDPKTDSYDTKWGEPGINCETCHGSVQEHVRVCREAEKGSGSICRNGPEGASHKLCLTPFPPEDLKLTVVTQSRGFSPHRVNALCATCHAKMVPISSNYRPGDRYFDHYDLIGLEHPDFYPDGRDLGENYTYTTWRMSPCVKRGKLDCIHCHTPSGRYRHKDDPDRSCLPCHKEMVENVAAHSHHPADSPGSRCIACHMPMTQFARMRRSDHSMLPPTPAATMAFKSPNACNICHKDKDAAWADKLVRQWHKHDYQAPVLHRAGLVDAARKGDWSRLPEIFAYLKSTDRDEIFAASLVKLIAACPATAPHGEGVPAAIIDRLENDPSPLVRAAAAGATVDNLYRPPLNTLLQALVKALGDEYRLVRIRAAVALAPVPPEMLDEMLDAKSRVELDSATKEFEAAMRVRPDDSASHYNLGNFYMARRQLPRAIEAFERSNRLDPRSLAPLVNASLAHSELGDNKKAEAALRRALRIDPDNAAANFNLGLLLGELNRLHEAEAALRRSLKTEPNSAPAAFNLGVILAQSKPQESLVWCKKAVELAPGNPKYAYTLAFYQQRGGDVKRAVETLVAAVARGDADASVYELLGSLYEKHRAAAKAARAYRRGAAATKLPPDVRRRFDAKARRLAPE